MSDFFSELSNKKWLVSRKEGIKFKLLEKIGESWENILGHLETSSGSEKYSSFLRGILTVLTTSGELAHYSYNIFLDSINELKENFNRYSRSIFNTIEINLLISIAFTTIVISSTLISYELSTLIVPTSIGLLVLSSLALASILEFMRPAVITIHSNKYKILNIILFLLILILYHFLIYIKILFIILIISIIISMLFYINEFFLWRKNRNLLIRMLHESAEKRRAGLTLQEAINPDDYDRLFNRISKSGINDNLARIIVELVKTSYNYGAGMKGVLDYLYFFAKDIDKLEIKLKAEGIIMTLFGVFLPALMLYFNLSLLTTLGNSAAIMKNVIIFYITLSLLTNSIISRSIDGTVYSGWRTFLSLFLVAFVYYYKHIHI